MANAFDEFDQQAPSKLEGSNPFDEFDQPAAKANAFDEFDTPKSPGYALRRPGEMKPLDANIKESFFTGIGKMLEGTKSYYSKGGLDKTREAIRNTEFLVKQLELGEGAPGLLDIGGGSAEDLASAKRRLEELRADEQRQLTNLNEANQLYDLYSNYQKSITPKDQSFLGKVVDTFAYSAGPLAAATGAFLAGQPELGIAAGAALGGAQVFVDDYKEMAAKGHDHLAATSYAAANALLESAGDRLGLKAASKPGMEMIQKLIYAMSVNAGEEAVVEALQGANEALNVNPNMTLGEYLESVAVAAASGMIGGGVAAPAGQAAVRLKGKAEAELEKEKLLSALEREVQKGLEAQPKLSAEEAAVELLKPRTPTAVLMEPGAFGGPSIPQGGAIYQTGTTPVTAEGPTAVPATEVDTSTMIPPVNPKAGFAEPTIQPVGQAPYIYPTTAKLVEFDEQTMLEMLQQGKFDELAQELVARRESLRLPNGAFISPVARAESWEAWDKIPMGSAKRLEYALEAAFAPIVKEAEAQDQAAGEKIREISKLYTKGLPTASELGAMAPENETVGLKVMEAYLADPQNANKYPSLNKYLRGEFGLSNSELAAAAQSSVSPWYAVMRSAFNSSGSANEVERVQKLSQLYREMALGRLPHTLSGHSSMTSPAAINTNGYSGVVPAAAGSGITTSVKGQSTRLLRAQKVVNAWAKKFLPGLDVAITLEYVDKFDPYKTYDGACTLERAGAGTTARYGMRIEIKEDLSQDKFLETLGHEFGHGMAGIMYDQASPALQAALKQLWLTYTMRSLRMGNFVEAMAERRGSVGLDELTQGFLPQTTAQALMQAMQKADPYEYRHDLGGDYFIGYQLSFDEFLAHQTERLLNRDYRGMGEDVKTFFSHLLSKLKLLFSKVKAEAPGLETKFGEWLEAWAAEAEAKGVQARSRMVYDLEAGVLGKGSQAVVGPISLGREIELGVRDTASILATPEFATQPLTAQGGMSTASYAPFDNWFSGSKVVTPSGTPLAMYVNSPAQIGTNEFQLYTSRHGDAESSDPKYAGGGVDPKGGAVSFWSPPRYIKILNPLVLERASTSREQIAQMMKSLPSEYDGIVVMEGGVVRWAAPREGKQVKSAFDSIGPWSTQSASMPPSFRKGLKKLEKLAGIEVDDPPELDRWGKIKEWFGTLINLARDNPHILELHNPTPALNPVTGYTEWGYLDLVQMYAAEKGKWVSQANERLREWRKLSRADQKRVGEILLDATISGTPVDFLALAQQGVSDQTLNVVRGVVDDFQGFYEAVRDALIAKVSRTHINNPALPNIVKDIQARFAQAMSKPYFPLSRFGKYLVIVKDADGKTVDFRSYDTKLEALRAVKGVKGAYPLDHTVKVDKTTEFQRGMSGIPPAVVEAMKAHMNLTPDQEKALDDMIYRMAPENAWVKHLISRKKTPGFSDDAQRAYTKYFFTGAGHVARSIYADQLGDAVKRLQFSATAMTDDSIKRREIANYVSLHFAEMMNPTNDWAGFRSVLAVAYLGGILRTVWVNLTQVPVFTYPHLAAKFGDVKAINELRKAYQDVRKLSVATRKLSPWENDALNKFGQGQPLNAKESAFVARYTGLSTDEHVALERGVRELILDQSFAMELASAASGNLLSRMQATSTLGYYARTLSSGLMYPFELVEKLNRRVTFLAAYRLARRQGVDEDTAYGVAKTAVQSTQFEYSKWNRPKLVQGKRGAFLLFMQYQLNALSFLLGGDRGWWRALAMLFMMGGVLGMPFVENMLDLATWMLSSENKKVDAKAELKKMTKLIFGDAQDLMLHGISRYGFGMLPWADMSGSISMGRPIPGTELLSKTTDPEKALIMGLNDFGGATTSLMLRMYKGMFDETLSASRRMEMLMPMSLGQQMMQAMRWYRDEAEKTPSGATVATFDWGDPWQIAEVAARGLGGFQPRVVSAGAEGRGPGREFLNTRNEMAAFYTMRRQILMGALSQAKMDHNREAQMEAMDEIRKYNSEVPIAGLKITGQQLRSSLKARAANQKKEDSGGTTKMERAINREMRE